MKNLLIKIQSHNAICSRTYCSQRRVYIAKFPDLMMLNTISSPQRSFKIYQNPESNKNTIHSCPMHDLITSSFSPFFDVIYVYILSLAVYCYSFIVIVVVLVSSVVCC